jgi:uncharacterized membrane protein YvlD (DUF360 family)
VSDYVWEFQLLMPWVIVAAIGAVLAFFVVRASWHSPTRPMIALGAGLVLFGVGAPLFWLGSWLMTEDITVCSTGTAVVAAAGLLTVLYSIQTRRG